MSHFGIAQRTAGDYIRRARERGFLGPAVGRGQPSEKTPDTHE
jgi:transposase